MLTAQTAAQKLQTSLAFIRTVRNWPEHYAAAYGLTRQPSVTYRLRSGMRFEARPRTLDAAVLKDVFIHKIYTPAGFEIQDGDVVIDVGAHIGMFSAYAARAASGVRVFAFEPAPENLSLLRRNLALNVLPHVTALPSAISGQVGFKDLQLSSNPAGHSFHFSEPGRGKVTVPTLTLARVMEEHRLAVIDLLKMDCEGDEYEILTSSAGATLGRVRKIAMEAHSVDDHRTPDLARRLLEEQGFTVRMLAKQDGTAMLWATREPSRKGLSSREAGGAG